MQASFSSGVALLLSGGMLLAAPVGPVHLARTPDEGLQPEVAVDAEGTVHLVYLKGDPAGCDVWYRTRRANQKDFSPAMRVNSQPGSAIALGTVRGAQLARGSNHRVHVVWNGSQPDYTAGARGSPMLYARLDETGTGFEPQRNLMTATMNLDGGGSVAADRSGNVFVIWHAHARNVPEADESNRGVYLARSTDAGKSFTPERKVDSGQTGVCGCCGLQAFADTQERLAILYRSADGVANRDMVLLVSTDHGESFRSRVIGRWHVSACPMSTQALGQGPGNTLLACWEAEGQIYRALIDPRDLSFKAGPAAAEGNPGNRKHPAVAFDKRSPSHLLLAWVEGTGWAKGGTLAWEYDDLQAGRIAATEKQSALARQDGVPAWTFGAVAPESAGGFTLLY
jgi:hypothetical protein